MSQIEALRQGKSGKCLQLQQREEHRVVQHVQLKHYQGRRTLSHTQCSRYYFQIRIPGLFPYLSLVPWLGY